MIDNSREKYAVYNSDYLSVTIDKQKGRIAFFGIESGGRDRDKHASYNLTIPAYGGVAGAFKKKAPQGNDITEEYASFKGGDKEIKYSFPNERQMDVEAKNPDSKDIFSVRWSIKTAPPTIWTEKAPKKLKLKSSDPFTFFRTEYTLPLIVHFPDFGRVEISSDSADVYCIEELQASRDFMGLDLGYLNHSYNHNRIHGLHYGSSFLTFKSKKTEESVALSFKVLEECYPSFPDEADERFNGLKRNWINSFAMNRELFDMGDNIYFHGTGHLAIHMKSDMLQFIGDDKQFDIVH